MEKKELRVTGTGIAIAKADMYRVTLNITNVLPTFAQATEEVAEKTNKLYQSMEEIGINRSEVKTASYNINTEYQWIDNSNKLVGYRYEHNLNIEFARDNELLNKVLDSLAVCNSANEFYISYFVKNQSKCRDLALKAAIKQCRSKAELIAKTAGVELKGIITIDYSSGVGQYASAPRMMNKMMAADAVNIEVNDINAQETVTIVFEIA